MLIDFLKSLPIASEAIPKIYIQVLEIDNYELDVIVIANTNNVPVYLTSRYPKKESERIINPEQIFSRVGDVNTSINETAHFYQVKELWRKIFNLNVPIQ